MHQKLCFRCSLLPTKGMRGALRWGGRGEAIGEAREGGTGRSARLVLWSIDQPVTPSVPAVGGAGTLSGSGSDENPTSGSQQHFPHGRNT